MDEKKLKEFPFLTKKELEAYFQIKHPEITIDREVSFRSGDRGVLHIGWYNDNPGTYKVKPANFADGGTEISCQNENAVNEDFLLVAPPVEVAGGNSQGWEALISLAEEDITTDKSGIYTCPVTIYSTESVDGSDTGPMKQTSVLVRITN